MHGPEHSYPTLSTSTGTSAGTSTGTTTAEKKPKQSGHKRTDATSEIVDNPAAGPLTRARKTALSSQTSGAGGLAPPSREPSPSGLSDKSGGRTASEEEEEDGGRRPAIPVTLEKPLIKLIPSSIRGGGGQKTLESTVRRPIAKDKIHATMDAIADVSKRMDKDFLEEWKDHEARKEAQNLTEPLEPVLTSWLMRYMFGQQKIGNIARADNEPAYGADVTYVLELQVEGLKFVILVQFKTKHKSGINWTHKNTNGAQLLLLLNRANDLRREYPSDTLVYAVFAVFTQHGMVTYAAEDIALQFELRHPDNMEMDTSVTVRREVEKALEKASPNPPGVGFLEKVVQLGINRKDKDLQKEAKAEIQERHPTAAAGSSKAAKASP
ncbi:hypothetical protein FRC17_003636 [Serendipita sp. 399]|nr:hypothetical protein FRC17_003636 [Serendipita sp. 399]